MGSSTSSSSTSNFNNALAIAQDKKVDTIWVIGGAEIYNIAFRHHDLNKIYLKTPNYQYPKQKQTIQYLYLYNADQ